MQPSSWLSSASLLQLGVFTLYAQSCSDAHLRRHAIEDIGGYSADRLHKRDWTVPDTDSGKRCGEGVGSCDPGDCCSPVGYCGRGYNHCASPNCQVKFSDGCDSGIKPLGESTLNVSRPLIGNVSYDPAGIWSCTKPGTVALTFDDGPYNWTSHLLDVLSAHNAKATFFLTGNNLGKGQIDIEETGWPAIIRRMHSEGHQIAAHTWGHVNLDSINETEVVKQVEYFEMAMRNILGFIPTYMRPPYTDCRGEACINTVKKLGYHIVYQDYVSYDWTHDDINKIEDAKVRFTNMMKTKTPQDFNSIFLMHDTHWQTSWNLTAYMLDYFKFSNFSTSTTVGDCLGDPKENWYRAAGGAPEASLLQHRRTSQANASQYSSILLYSSLLLICGQFIAGVFL